MQDCIDRLDAQKAWAACSGKRSRRSCIFLHSGSRASPRLKSAPMWAPPTQPCGQVGEGMAS